MQEFCSSTKLCDIITHYIEQLCVTGKNILANIITISNVDDLYMLHDGCQPKEYETLNTLLKPVRFCRSRADKSIILCFRYLTVLTP